ncbi:PEGA domain-containing protein [Corallococcus llansteffanensis]|uniref:PEGA domain-containing protein n=1 Tax=Corallococcus llansteffanensis TaxID=2316731 RepID=A0A3A8QFC9_9BACT|nr:PEGA domain-containing protein [Corallococcus llansteffanensis]RKH66371.1 PEGA domain-containing protein [Corallococcus llansteffanensis]
MSASWFLMSLLLASAPPGTEPRELEAALQALSEADFEAALSRVEAGLRQTRDETHIARLRLVQGEVYAALRQYAQMETAFAQALEADPDAHLDPERVQPTVVTLFESLRGRLQGVLAVDVEPSGAEVHLDGRRLGQAPWQGSVPIGTHTLDVGPGLTTLQVKVRPGRTEQVRVVLPPPAPESASFVSTLAFSAQVRAALGLSPLSGAGMEAGARLSGTYVFGELNATVGSRFGAAARLGAQAPRLVGPLTFFLSLDGYALGGPALLGGGLSLGTSLPLSRKFDVFAELSGRWLPSSDTYQRTHLLGVSGLRFTPGR